MNGVEPSHEKIDGMRELCKSDGRINLRSGVYVRGESGKISFESDAALEDIFVKTDLKGKITVEGIRLNSLKFHILNHRFITNRN